MPADLRAELDSFLLSLEAENLAPKTRRTCADAVDQLGRFLVARGMPTHVGAIAAVGALRRRSAAPRLRVVGSEDLRESEPDARAESPLRSVTATAAQDPLPILTPGCLMEADSGAAMDDGAIAMIPPLHDYLA